MLGTRKVQPGDLHTIAAHRRGMFEDMGADPATLDVMTQAFAIWLKPRLEDGRYFGYFVEENGAVVAGAGMMLLDWPPHTLHPERSQRGYIFNLFVEPEYRGHGIATDLTRLAESDLQACGVTYAVLHASTKGREVYEKLGWTSTKEMGRILADG
jgi:ribosomal protein S18 acetylase RimI-like enzyme